MIDGLPVFTQRRGRESKREREGSWSSAYLLFESASNCMLLVFKDSHQSPLGGRKRIDLRQEMDCAKLKQTEKFFCNYNCVQLALT